MTTVSPTTGSYSYVNPNGEQITVSMRGDGGAVTECSNGTTTVHNPDGSSRSVNDPLGGAPVVVEIAPLLLRPVRTPAQPHGARDGDPTDVPGATGRSRSPSSSGGRPSCRTRNHATIRGRSL